MVRFKECSVKGCSNRVELSYYGKGVCGDCFAKFSGDELKKKLKIKG